MGITIRHYIVQDDGALRRVPKRICAALPFGKDAIPEYASTRQRVVEVIVENDGRRPVRILDANGSYWTFDAEGQIDQGLHETMGEWMEVAFDRPKPKGTVVDLVPEIRKKELHERHRWTLTKDELDLISADIWPGVHGPAPDVTVVKGKAPRKPPLSWQARDALNEIERQLEAIRHRIVMLNEHALKGLEFEARRTASFEKPALWNGVADQVKLQREIRAAYRTGKGEWVAVVEAYRAIDPIAEETAAIAHERCKSQNDAIEAGKRLLAEKAEWLGPETRIEGIICSALEWQGDSADDLGWRLTKPR